MLPFQNFIDHIKEIYQPEINSKVTGQQRHYTLIVDGAAILSIGTNHKFKTHPLAKKFGHRFAAIHSELDAIRRLKYPIDDIRQYGYDVVNIRLNKDKKVLLAKPCLSCQAMLYTFGIKKIYFTTNHAKIEKMVL